MTTSEQNNTSLLDATGEWAAAAADRLGLTVQLVMAEARLAVLSVVTMVVIGILMAFTVAAIWAIAVVIVAAALMQSGLNLVSTCLILIAAHSLLLVLLSLFMTKVARSMSFRATRRQAGLANNKESSYAVATAKA